MLEYFLHPFKNIDMFGGYINEDFWGLVLWFLISQRITFTVEKLILSDIYAERNGILENILAHENEL